MSVVELRVEGYRSIRSLTLPMKRVNVVVGPNGCGKSNLYQSINLLYAAAAGNLARVISQEGGMSSVLWAGPRKEGPVRLKVGVTFDDYEYDLEVGLPTPGLSYFGLDPVVKSELIVQRQGKRKVALVERGSSSYKVRGADGAWHQDFLALNASESILTQLVDPAQYPILDDVRRRILKWRFYHEFRTDRDSVMRRPQIGTRTVVLSADGSDLASALQTIRENGDVVALEECISDAFPGSSLRIEGSALGMFVGMDVPGLNRAMSVREISDGTLRYLCLLAALLSPRPATLLALNEPENSLHPSLIEPLGRLIARAGLVSQIWLTTHSQTLADSICDQCSVRPVSLDRIEGETVRAGRPMKAAYSEEWDG